MDLITYPLNGVTYDAEDVATYLCTRTSGVYSKDSNFTVSITGAREITVSPGLAWINYDDFKGVSVCARKAGTLAVPEADDTLGRIDRIVLQFDADANCTTLKLKRGTLSANPAAPAILQNHRIYELGLADITVPAGSTTVTAANITDTRLDESLCGVMSDGVTGIPTGELLKQWQAVQAQQEADARQSTADLLAESRTSTEQLQQELQDKANQQLQTLDETISADVKQWQSTVDAHVEDWQEKADKLDEETQKLQNGSFYTKGETDANLKTAAEAAVQEVAETGAFKGDKGDVGPQGPKGDTGATGPQGPAGTSAVYTSGTGYVRYTDGTQICWGYNSSLSDYPSTNRDVTFKAAFANTDYALLAITTSSQTYGVSDATIYTLDSKKTTGCRLYPQEGSEGASWVVFGRWK